MKLNLKVGDKVYDQLLFPNQEGEINYIDKYYFTVLFDSKEYFYPYKDDDEDSDNHFPAQLSKTPYQIIGLTNIFLK